jgi:hypothetical protein
MSIKCEKRGKDKMFYMHKATAKAFFSSEILRMRDFSPKTVFMAVEFAGN